MNSWRCFQQLAACLLATMLIASGAQSADSSPGTIVGMVTNLAQHPLARVTVTAVNADGSSIRSTLSGSDGVYSFADLTPGTWSVTTHVDGVADVSASALEVVGRQATRYDVVMNTSGVGPAGNVTSSVASAAAVPPARVVAAVEHPVSSVFDNTIGQLLLSGTNRKSIVVAQAAAPVPPAAPAATPVPTVPEALQAPDPAPAGVDTYTPFGQDDDIGWLNGQGREKSPIFDTKFFTPEIRFDVNYMQDFNHPVDHTIDGSTEAFRSQEVQIEQVSFGGDFHGNNVRARFLSMMGLFAVTTPRNDASYGVGQWDLQGAYKYFSEANAGYHWDNVGHGLNVDAGIFVSYIGLFSYYNYDNWTYQPSFVSSNTPWFFNGLRIQYWPTQNLKIEPWLINGWQSYAMFNGHPGVGGQILWIPNNNLKLVFNSYTLGQDNLHTIYQNCNGSYLNAPNLLNGYAPTAAQCVNAPYINTAKIQRVHEDDSILYRYYESHGQNGAGISKAAFSLTVDVGCQYGGGVSCTRGPNKDNFVGAMLYNRIWFDRDLFAITTGGGFMNNPGRYLALLPPINGANAALGTPYWTENPGQKLYQWDSQINLQYMPKDWITWWTETTFRHSDVPYWSGNGGITPPSSINGTQEGTVPGGLATNGDGSTWYPDLRKREVIWGAGVMVKF
jgi:hypothetical protein